MNTKQQHNTKPNAHHIDLLENTKRKEKLKYNNNTYYKHEKTTKGKLELVRLLGVFDLLIEAE